MTRISILTPDEMNDQQRAVIEASKASGKPHGGPFWAYIRNPKLMQNVQNIGACIADSTLQFRHWLADPGRVPFQWIDGVVSICARFHLSCTHL